MLFRRLSAFVALISLGLQQICPVCALPVDSDDDFTLRAHSANPVSLRQEKREARILSSRHVTKTGVSESFLAFDLASKTARLYSRDGELLQANLSCTAFPWDKPTDKLEAYLPHCWFSVQEGAFAFYGRLLGGFDSFGGDPCSVNFGGGNYSGDWSSSAILSNNSSVHVSVESGGQGGGGGTYMHPVEAPVASPPPANPPTLSEAHKHPGAPRCVDFTPKHTPESHLLAHLVLNPYYAAAGYTVESGKGGKSHEVAGTPAAAGITPPRPSPPVVAPVVPVTVSPVVSVAAPTLAPEHVQQMATQLTKQPRERSSRRCAFCAREDRKRDPEGCGRSVSECP